MIRFPLLFIFCMTLLACGSTFDGVVKTGSSAFGILNAMWLDVCDDANALVGLFGADPLSECGTPAPEAVPIPDD